MLSLRRNVGEVIRIDGDISVMLLEAGNGWARIGIDAPKNVVVDRQEVFEKKLRERMEQQLDRS